MILTIGSSYKHQDLVCEYNVNFGKKIALMKEKVQKKNKPKSSNEEISPKSALAKFMGGQKGSSGAWSHEPPPVCCRSVYPIPTRKCRLCTLPRCLDLPSPLQIFSYCKIWLIQLFARTNGCIMQGPPAYINWWPLWNHRKQMLLFPKQICWLWFQNSSRNLWVCICKWSR